METNERGNTVTRSYVDGDRYEYDFGQCRHALGWRQYDTDQDAWYFGVWYHLERREIVTFAEGDLTVIRCPDDAHMKVELQFMADFYGPPPAAATVISPDGSVTKVYDSEARPPC